MKLDKMDFPLRRRGVRGNTLSRQCQQFISAITRNDANQKDEEMDICLSRITGFIRFISPLFQNLLSASFNFIFINESLYKKLGPIFFRRASQRKCFFLS